MHFRCTGLSGSGFCGFSEMTVRLDELATAPRGIARVYVVENEITYLAFPLTGDAMVIFGAGIRRVRTRTARLAGRTRPRLLG